MDRLDSQGMWDVTLGLPDQVEAAAEAARGLEGLPEHSWVEQVVVLGMGGSGIAGDLLAAIAAPLCPVPITVVKGYELPAFVGEGTLVFASSFSGGTEETLEAVGEAAMQGAKVVAVTSGGELARMAAGWGAPRVEVPTTIPQPRAAIGALAVPLMVVMEELDLFPGASAWIKDAVGQLRARRTQLESDASPARAIARTIGRTIPLVAGGGPIGAVAAQRWKAQVNENAKAPAFWAAQPELCHNEVCGWGQHGDVTRQVFTLVNLRHDAEHPQVSRRFELVTDLLRETVSDVVEVCAEGEGELAQLFDLIYVGDVVSLELAAAEGLDPGPVPVLVDLKKALAAGRAPA